MNKPVNAFSNFWYLTNMLNVKPILSYFSKYGYKHGKKMIKPLFLLKQDMPKVWCYFDQNLSVFIEDISIWNLEKTCFSNDNNENWNHHLVENFSNQCFRMWWKAIEQARANNKPYLSYFSKYCYKNGKKTIKSVFSC